MREGHVKSPPVFLLLSNECECVAYKRSVPGNFNCLLHLIPRIKCMLVLWHASSKMSRNARNDRTEHQRGVLMCSNGRVSLSQSVVEHLEFQGVSLHS